MISTKIVQSIFSMINKSSSNVTTYIIIVLQIYNINLIYKIFKQLFFNKNAFFLFTDFLMFLFNVTL